MEFEVWVPTRVNRPNDRQSTTRMVSGGQYISCSGSSMSRNFTVEEKFGFFLALRMTELWMTWPPHSTSTRGRSTGRNWTLLRSRRPQKSTSKRYLTSVGRISGGIGITGPESGAAPGGGAGGRGGSGLQRENEKERAYQQYTFYAR
jgi:hypothetical protein